jgi:hypothetical protein
MPRKNKKKRSYGGGSIMSKSSRQYKNSGGDVSPQTEPSDPKLKAFLLEQAANKAEEKRLNDAWELFHENKRAGKQEGGMAEEPMAMPPEMMEEPTEDVPVDTYPNATPEEVEEAQEPDEEMEEGYIEFVLNEALVPEEQEYLMNTLEDDPQLSQIFDKVVETASEFSGAGEVTGPGDGLSDSIPARLSDGEFVFTKKATDQLGADNLQTMMDDAERAYDGGMMRENRYLGGVIQDNEKELGLEKRDDEIRQLMNMEMSVKANKTPSLR